MTDPINIDPTLSAALAEAYASVPMDEVVLVTLEFAHPDIIDEDGGVLRPRFVNDHADLEARLEASAPADADQVVTFVSTAFDLKVAPVEVSPSPEMQLDVDNVSGELTRHLNAVATSPVPVTVIFRTYLRSTALMGPAQLPVMAVDVREASVTPTRLSGKASGPRLGDRAFGKIYRGAQFPSLDRG